MTTERQLSASPVQGGRNDLVVAEVLPIGSAGVTLISAADTPRQVVTPGDPISTILVPLGELDYFSVRHLTDAAAAHMVGTYRSVILDLSAVSFCDSSIGSLLNWVGGLSDELEVTVVTGPAVERVLGLLSESSVHRPRVQPPNEISSTEPSPTDPPQPKGDGQPR